MPFSINKCPYCQSSVVAVYWKESGFWKCSTCGLFFRNPMPSEEDLERLYNTSWIDPEQQRSETGGTDDRLARIYANYLAKDLGIKDFSKMRLLDFGAGRGAFSRALRELGADVFCVEPFGYDYLKSAGFHVYRSLTEIDVSERFDGAVTIDVWEHLTKPWDILASICRLLYSNGWVFVAIPNPTGLNARIFRGKWREGQKRGHILFPEPRTVVDMLRKSGFAAWHRCRWPVEYSSNPIKRMLDWGLYRTQLDGELRYIAWKT